MLHFRFDNTYARLPARFYVRHDPTPVAAPALVALNHPLVHALGLDPEALAGPEGVAVLSGNRLPDGAQPLAQAYAGHQFGGWSPQLGDGRALLLGEVIGGDGQHYDIQLKGSGPTPFSRRGDGRAWLGPVLREYLVSEAMAGLGVPTTRALAALTTGEDVWRETALPGAVLVRVASSHIRVGTFQYFAARRDHEALALLAEYARTRHFPQTRGALGLLEAAVAAQAELIARWMALGFIHGVMNTDNCHIAGLTIDYGPCAFIDDYHPDRVFSSIDQFGRYAYANQPQIAVWNLAQFASALLPVIAAEIGAETPVPATGMAAADGAQDRPDPALNAAIEAATAAIETFGPAYRAAWRKRMAAKIGLDDADPQDDALIEDLLGRMAAVGADFTRVFRALAERGEARNEFPDPAAFDGWAEAWQARLSAHGARPDTPQIRALMAAANPAIIPRNHRVEAVIAAAVAGDYAPFERLAAALSAPFDPAPEFDDLRAAPGPDEAVRRTFCGT